MYLSRRYVYVFMCLLLCVYVFAFVDVVYNELSDGVR